MVDFHGSKLALIIGSKLLVYRRDRNKQIPFPGCWDFPGGGREGTESPEECVLRELYEEFAIRLTQERLLYRRDYSVPYRTELSCFFAAHATTTEIEEIKFGDEGELWCIMEIEDYLTHSDAVPNLQQRLRDYLSFIA